MWVYEILAWVAWEVRVHKILALVENKNNILYVPFFFIILEVVLICICS